MDPMRLMNDRKYGRTFLLLALLFLLSGGYLKLMALEKENLSRSLEEENRQVEIFSKAPHRPSSLPFLESLFSPASPAFLVNAAEEGGLKVDAVFEKVEEGENGIFHIFHISGTGTYAPRGAESNKCLCRILLWNLVKTAASQNRLSMLQ